MYIFVSGKDRMLVQGEFDQNLVHRSTGSVTDVFKQTILEQEAVFRKQVHDLHQLYRMQKTLMKGVVCEEFDGFSSWKYTMHSSLTPLMSSSSHKPLAKETQVSLIPMRAAGTKQPISQEMSEGHLGMYYKLQRRPLDLQLSADQYIGHVDDDPVDLKLSLSVGQGNRRKGAKRTWFDKKTHPLPATVIDLEESSPITSNCSETVVIDLEESPERTSIGDAKLAPSLGCNAPITYFGGKQEAKVPIVSDPIISGRVKKDPSQEITESSCLVDDNGCYQKHNSLHGEFIECYADIECKNFFAKKQRVISLQDGPLDLNKVQPNDSSCYMTNHSTASSADVFKGQVGRIPGGFSSSTTSKEKFDNWLNEISGIRRQDDAVNAAWTNSSGKNQRAKTCRNFELDEAYASEVNLTGSVLSSSLDLCEGLGSPRSEPKNEEDKLTSKVQDGLIHGSNSICVATGQGSCEKSVVEDIAVLCSDSSQNAVPNECGNKSPASSKSRCVSDDDSCSIKTMQSGTDFVNSNSHASLQFSGTDIGRAAESSEPKQQYPSKKEESAQVDDMIQGAAESLIHISRNNTPSHQDCSTKEGSNGMENEKMERPQNSADSYELIAMKLTESNEDDYCVSSKPLEVNDFEKQDYSCKLRRGRRLKDFQKDILPGLSCLSRHEIREDINILEGVLRSREYRKMRAMKADGGSWCVPARSRRSRVCGRRKFS